MAAGQGVSSIDIDRWLFGVLSADALLQIYTGNGFGAFSADHPPQTVKRCVRWWQQSAGHDTARQDGRMGRVMSSPAYVIVMLDRQPFGQVDKVYGTLGASLGTPQRYLELGAARIYDLLHARSETVNGFTWFASRISEYCRADPTGQGGYEVMVGHWFQFRVS